MNKQLVVCLASATANIIYLYSANIWAEHSIDPHAVGTGITIFSLGVTYLIFSKILAKFSLNALLSAVIFCIISGTIYFISILIIAYISGQFNSLYRLLNSVSNLRFTVFNLAAITFVAALIVNYIFNRFSLTVKNT